MFIKMAPETSSRNQFVASYLLFLMLLVFVQGSTQVSIDRKSTELKLPVSDCTNTIATGTESFSNAKIKLSSTSDDTINENESIPRRKTIKKLDQIKVKPCKGVANPSDKNEKEKELQQSCLRHGKGSDMNWHVLLWRTDENMYFCQGALIDKKWILSLAHCLVGYDGSYIKAESIKVRVNGGAKDLSVTEVIVHENFVYYTFKDDVALLKLAKPMKNGVPICLPESMDPLVHQKLKTSWWEGDVFEEDAVGGFFKDVVNSKRGLDVCKRKVAAQSISYSLDDKNLCTESPNYCNGDFWQRLTDASPIFTEETNKLTLYGIKSWGTIAFFCNSGSEVHVNVDISQYMKWIMEAIRK
eukprot:Seg1512.8 transcript_id=Seg1512.8/GoldUCD/mRNA.D3Y31 product="Mite allergen Der f 3" protein_id=Seg1512.8/GoldUCD/D3Y31